MNEALMALQLLNALLATVSNASMAAAKVSALIQSRAAEGKTVTQADLEVLFAEGDEAERALYEKFKGL